MYLVDLRKGKAPIYPLGRYALYIAFFPQALAGPLARWSQVIDQFGSKIYAPGWQREFCLGISFIAMGLFEKSFWPTGSAGSSIRSMRRRCLVRWQTVTPGWR